MCLLHVMSPQEYDLYHYLNRTPGQFVSIYEIVKQVGGNRSFANGRYWALESLKRMEAEGLIEHNDSEEFRIRHLPDDTTQFLRALQSPGAPLGDTTIITIADVAESV